MPKTISLKKPYQYQKHGIDFNDAIEMFKHPLLSLEDNREHYGEERWLGIGWIKNMMGLLFIPNEQVISYELSVPEKQPKKRCIIMNSTATKTDWKRSETLSDDEIDTSDIPELDENFFKNAKFREVEKQTVTLKLDTDILD